MTQRNNYHCMMQFSFFMQTIDRFLCFFATTNDYIFNLTKFIG